MVSFMYLLFPCVQKNPPLGVILSQMNPVNALVRKIYFILFSHIRLVSKVLSSHQVFRREFSIHFSFPSCMLHAHLLLFLVYFTTLRQLHRLHMPNPEWKCDCYKKGVESGGMFQGTLLSFTYRHWGKSQNPQSGEPTCWPQKAQNISDWIRTR